LVDSHRTFRADPPEEHNHARTPNYRTRAENYAGSTRSPVRKRGSLYILVNGKRIHPESTRSPVGQDHGAGPHGRHEAAPTESPRFAFTSIWFDGPPLVSKRGRGRANRGSGFDRQTRIRLLVARYVGRYFFPESGRQLTNARSSRHRLPKLETQFAISRPRPWPRPAISSAQFHVDDMNVLTMLFYLGQIARKRRMLRSKPRNLRRIMNPYGADQRQGDDSARHFPGRHPPGRSKAEQALHVPDLSRREGLTPKPTPRTRRKSRRALGRS